MTAGTYVAGVVLTILSLVSFNEGGLYIIPGIICGLAVIGLGWTLFFEDEDNDKIKERKDVK